VSTLLLSHCRLLVTMDDARRELVDVSIVIEDGWIRSIESTPEGLTAEETIDCRDMVVVPGLINTHHHLYQTLTRAFAQSEGQTLFPWLRQLYPVWRGLDEEMILTSTRAGLAELALSGCTTSSDHLYVFPTGSDGFMDAQVSAASEIGLRFHPTRGSMDLGESAGGLPPDSVVQSIPMILKDSERVIERYHDPRPGAMVRVGLAPCSPFSVSPDLMRESAALARHHHVRLHTHIAETLDEEAYSRAGFGMSPIELLGSLDWLEKDVWLAHGVHLSEDDIQALAHGGTSVAHCPTSNMLLGSGLAPVRSMLDAGVTVGLGVDGSASNDANDLGQEVKQAVLTARVRDGAGAMSARAALALATRGGARCLGREDIGSIEVGKTADLAFFDVSGLEVAGGHSDLVTALVLGSLRPDTVIVHGRPIVRGGQLVNADARDLARKLNASSSRLLERAGLMA
jgi:8-oxoguanine deaminase